MTKYVPVPVDGRKSFYGKCYVTVDDNDLKTLYSYDTKIVTKDADGNYKRYWKGYTVTTGRHMWAAFGLDKKTYSALPVEK